MSGLSLTHSPSRRIGRYCITAAKLQQTHAFIVIDLDGIANATHQLVIVQ